MNEPVFIFEMQRLNENFKNFYTKSKIKLIQNIVSGLPEHYFSKCIEKALWADRPPKIEWFHEIVSSYRKKQSVISSIEQMHPQENSAFGERDISMMMEYLRRRQAGRLTDQEWHDFLKTIREIAASKFTGECRTCLDIGAYLPYMGTEIVDCSCRKAS